MYPVEFDVQLKESAIKEISDVVRESSKEFSLNTLDTFQLAYRVRFKYDMKWYRNANMYKILFNSTTVSVNDITKRIRAMRIEPLRFIIKVVNKDTLDTLVIER